MTADYLAIADSSQRLLAELRDLNPFEQVATAGRLVEAAENIHEGGLAAAAGSHDRNELPALDLHADPAQRMHACFAQVIVFVDIVDLNDDVAICTARCFYREL